MDVVNPETPTVAVGEICYDHQTESVAKELRLGSPFGTISNVKSELEMSKCYIQISFDRTDRTYRGGETVSGEVRISVNQDIRCNGIVLTHYWKTHGRGNTDSGEKHTIQLADMAPLQAGEELRLPFEFKSQLWPLTYHGDCIYLDHYVHVGVDVPWSIDPKHEEEFMLLPGERPPEFTGDRGEVVEIEKPQTESGAIAKVIGYSILAIILVMLSVAFFMIIPFLLIGGGGYWIWKKMIASRVGEVDLKIPHVVVGPAEQLPVELSFTAKKAFPINGIFLKVFAQESATSGSGTNKTTHHNTIHEEVHTLRPESMLTAGEVVSENVMIDLPETSAWSLDEGSNDVKWTVEARIDIPRFPDWSNKTSLQMVPVEFLDGPNTATSTPSDMARTSSLRTESSSPPPLPTFSAELPQVSTQPDTTNESPATGEDMGPLLRLVDEILAAGRFSNERTEIAEASEGHTYDVVIEIERISTTFGFSGDEPQLENGRTVLGKLVGTNHEVQLFSCGASNESLDELSRGEVWSTLAIVANWDTLYDRLVLHEVPFE